jgi:hypothetical protein
MELDGNRACGLSSHGAQRACHQQKCHNHCQDKCAKTLVHDNSSIIHYLRAGHTCPHSLSIKAQPFSQVNNHFVKTKTFGKTPNFHGFFW